jgi:glucosamine-6-phosphate deaminase
MVPIQTFNADRLHVNVYATRDEMGMAAAKDAATAIRQLLNTKPFVNIIFAAAPSQNEMLFHLAVNDEIDWSRVNAFHMDEYVGLNENVPQRFGHFLEQAIFGKQTFNTVYYINGDAADPAAECSRYAALLEAHPVDMVCMGIGENTHLAFNDPHVANFNDPFMVKLVALDEVSRMQQVHDGCFASIDEVPQTAITVGPKETWNAEKVSIWHAGMHDNPLGQRLTALMISKRLADSSVPMSLLADHQNVQFNYYRGGLGSCAVEMH